MKKILSILLIVSIALFTTGCLRKKEPTVQQQFKDINLTYYKMFDDEDTMDPLISEYQTKNPGVRIHYKKFTDFEDYMNTIVNELAEGEGPDIFSAQNTWFYSNLKKLQPAPPTLVTPDIFDKAFVDVASKDLILTGSDGQRYIYGIPLTVDTLALYYNKDHYSDKLPEIGRPPTTWAELMDHVYEMTEEDDSYERFAVSGIAMGRADNITRAVDILYMLMLQLGTSFYNKDLTEATFTKQYEITETGKSVVPALEALKFFISFAVPDNKNYSWNGFIVSPDSDEKEIEAFAKGKVSMIIGYSYMYEQIMDHISELKGKGQKTISPSVVRVAKIPQMVDAASEKRTAYANYFAETVSRTSKYPEEAWNFLLYLGSKDALQKYNKSTKKPTSRRDLIDEQKLDPTYGVFVDQIGYSESFPIFDYWRYKDIFTDAIQETLLTDKPDNALRTAEAEIIKLLPKTKLTTKPAQNGTQAPTQKIQQKSS